MKKIVYIAHAISGDIDANLADIRRIVKIIHSTFPDVIPFVPYYCDVVTLDDSVKEERSIGITNNIIIINSGIVKEVWITGNIISSGVQLEIDIANVVGIPVINKSFDF